MGVLWENLKIIVVKNMYLQNTFMEHLYIFFSYLGMEMKTYI